MRAGFSLNPMRNLAACIYLFLRWDEENRQASLILQSQNRSHLFLTNVYRYYDVEGIGRYLDSTRVGPVYRLIRKC